MVATRFFKLAIEIVKSGEYFRSFDSNDLSCAGFVPIKFVEYLASKLYYAASCSVRYQERCDAYENPPRKKKHKIVLGAIRSCV